MILNFFNTICSHFDTSTPNKRKKSNKHSEFDFEHICFNKKVFSHLQKMRPKQYCFKGN